MGRHREGDGGPEGAVRELIVEQHLRSRFQTPDPTLGVPQREFKVNRSIDSILGWTRMSKGLGSGMAGGRSTAVLPSDSANSEATKA